MCQQNPRHEPESDRCRHTPHATELPPWLTAVIAKLGLTTLATRVLAECAAPPYLVRQSAQPCRQVLDSLSIPEPFELTAFLAHVASLRGRQIYVRPFTAHGICGAWIRTRSGDYIYHDRHTTRLHQTHIVLHEVAHMLLGHEGASDPTTEVARLLAPDLSDQLITLMLGRGTSYASAKERDAENLASIILEGSARPATRSATLKANDRQGRMARRRRAFWLKRGAGW